MIRAPLATTLADYLHRGRQRCRRPRLDHMETPRPSTQFGFRASLGGAIAPPAAIANAVKLCVAFARVPN